MTVAYWIVAALLALLYLYSGGLKVLRSPDQLRPMMGWIDTVPLRLVRTIGVLEVLGALGLILPPLTGTARPSTQARTIARCGAGPPDVSYLGSSRGDPARRMAACRQRSAVITHISAPGMWRRCPCR
jgi:hypothetical protein